MKNLNISARLLFVLLSCLILASCSKEEKFQEGTHYQVYDNVIADQVEILPEIKDSALMEFFSYGCSHCRNFAPILDEWQNKNPYSSVAYVPIIWGEETELYANIYYLIQSTTNFKDIHHELFKVVGEFSRTDSLDEKKIRLITFLQEKGIQPIDVVNAINNNSMKLKTASALMLAKRFEVSATPNLVVNGRYKLDNSSVKTLEELLEVASELISSKS